MMSRNGLWKVSNAVLACRGAGALLMLLLEAIELEAIEDCQRMLRFSEEEEHRYNEEQKRRALEEAEQKLRSIAPSIQKRFNDKAKE